ncbi:MAG TPA: Calx-beta domain-containing protein [Thermoanaerobaculaceae bacterium]|nr:Calx-beta domain-containing protein [Thermoanaerobaculaceae bacterium]HRS16820.1 Calx-beta domain-containing protein [Thermoanaerobaculaceae bacterium]
MRNSRIWIAFALVAALTAFVSPAPAQVPISAFGTPYTQDFNSLANSGTSNPWVNNTTLLGWYAAQQAGTLSTYRADNGGSNTGALYSFGSTGASERALGSVSSGTPQTIYYGVRFVNNTGAQINALAVSYTGEQWRNGGNTTQHKLEFQYQVGAPGSITGGTWTNFDTLDFTGPIATSTAGALDGNAAANRVALSATITLVVLPDQEVWLRWYDVNDAGNDHGLGLDDLSVTASDVALNPSLSINSVAQNEGNSGTTTFAFTVSLSSPALAGGVSFDIATADGTATVADNDYAAGSAIGATIAEGGTSYTFNVTVNGDTAVEPDETFYVNVTNVTGATVANDQGVGTILNDDGVVPALSIDDVAQLEGSAGTTTFAFTVSLSSPALAGGVSFDIATADGTATVADNDYAAGSAIGATIAEGGTSYTFNVTVNGDTAVEPDETFYVNVTNVTGATVSKGQGIGTIQNDDLPPALIINEILADPASGAAGDANGDGVTNSSDDEFVEIVNNTGADVDISGWTLSDAAQLRHVFPAGTIVANNCSVVVFGGGTPTGVFGGSVVQTASTGALGLNNGGDTVTLRLGTATVATTTYGAEGGNDQSLTRSPDFTGSFVQHTTAPGAGGARFSPGKLLTGYPFSGCTITPIVAEIYDIQGPGLVSPYVGQYVTTSGNVVTALAADGFFVQTPDARDDNDPDTSNGVFVYTASAPTVSVGDVVDVTGEVKEYFNFTEITFPTVTTVATGAPMPTAIVFDATRPDNDPGNPPPPSCAIEYECWEGMLIHVANGMVSGPNQRFGSDPFAEMYAVASPNRPFREPGIKFPGLPGLPVWDGNPEVFELDADRLGLPSAVMPPGTPFTATGVLAYEFSGWELWPTGLTFGTPPALPRAVRARNPFEMTVGSLNLLNYNSASADYATRSAKHSAYIRTVLGAPDVLGVAEVENLATLQGLANRIHADDPSLTYTAYLGPVDRSGIDVGFLVRDTVTNVVITQLGADEIFPLDGSLLHDRPPLLLEGDWTGNGAPFHFAVMVNHTRSLLNIDAPDPEGNRVRQKRLAQAQSIAQMVQTYQTANPATPFVLVGDYNAYEFTDGYVDLIGQIVGDAVQADNLVWAPPITTPVLTRQVLTVPAADRYSYVHEGTSQVIDHALTTQATDTWARGMAFGRGNADAAEQFLYDGSTLLRGSDHDGLVLYLVTDGNANGLPDDLDEADLSITKTDSPDPILSGGALTYTLAVANNGPAPAFDVTVTDTLPAGVAFGTASGTGWSCSHLSGTVTCTRPALAVGPAPDITITVTAPVAGTTLTNTATVACPLADPVPANNSDTQQTTVQPSADLAITQAGASPTPAAPGQWFLFQAEATNLGPADAANAWLTITVPTGASTGLVNPGAGCTLVGQDVACPFGTVPAGGSVAMNVEVLLAASGSYSFTSTFSSDTFDPDLANNTATTLVSVGQVLVTPTPINMRVPIFSSGQTTLTVTNDSPLDIGYRLFERSRDPIWPRAAVQGPTWSVPTERAADRSSAAAPVPELSFPAVEPLVPDAAFDFDTGLSWPWGIGLDTSTSSAWIGDEDNVNYRFLLDGTPTGDTIDTTSWCPLPNWAADMAYDPVNQKLWQVLVGLDNCIYEMDPATKTSTGNKICPAFGTSERGLAYDPFTDTFFAGSWTDGRIKRFDRDGTILENVALGLPISGLAYNPGTGHLFVLLNTDAAADFLVLDTNDGYALLRAHKLAGMGSYEQAGLEIGCDGNYYAVNQVTTRVLVGPSGEPQTCIGDVPWLDETPAAGNLSGGASASVLLDFITAQQWPGLHRGELIVAGTEPFRPTTVPVNYTIAFLDVPDEHWADPFIHALAGARVSRGCGFGNFCPDNEVTRAEMAILMVRAMHGPLYSPPPATGIFVDVPVSDTDRTADFVEQLYRDGVVAGCAVGGDGERYYCPNDLVSRAQMAVFITAGSGIPPVNPPVGYFIDVHGTEFQWAEGFIEAIYNAGITGGCDVARFCPAEYITRAQLAVWLVVAFDIPYLPGS